MNETLGLIFALAVGIVLGVIFIGGLWWTVRIALTSKAPAVWFLVSMSSRTAIVIAGFYLFLADDWKKLLAGLCGFVIARFVVTRYTKVAVSNEAVVGGEHAS